MGRLEMPRPTARVNKKKTNMSCEKKTSQTSRYTVQTSVKNVDD